MTFNQYYRLVLDRQLEGAAREGGDPWRAGQIYFNLLHQVRPDLAGQICGSEKDPFHRNDRILPFLEWLIDAWDKE
jgi:hypothetical protein